MSRNEQLYQAHQEAWEHAIARAETGTATDADFKAAAERAWKEDATAAIAAAGGAS
jgi:hypothetical protein